MKGTMFIFGELCLIYKACEIASEFEIEVSRPCVVGRQRNGFMKKSRRRFLLLTKPSVFISKSTVDLGLEICRVEIRPSLPPKKPLLVAYYSL
jgi:hypothetical protein